MAKEVKGSVLDGQSHSYYGPAGLRSPVGVNEQLSEIVIGLAPFVPFSQAFTLHQTSNSGGIMIAPQSQGEDLVSNIINYERATGDPTPDADPRKTLEAGERVRSIRTLNNELGQLMQQATAFGFEKNPRTSVYVGPQEVATKEIASDIFDKLPANDKDDIFDLQLDSEVEILRMHSESFDLGMSTVDERQRLHTSLLALSKVSSMPDEMLRRVSGIEVTAAGGKAEDSGKYVQKAFRNTYRESGDIDAAFGEAANEWVSAINQTFSKVAKKGDSIADVLAKTKGGKANKELGILAPNMFELNQALRRMQDMQTMATNGAKRKNLYVYSVPLNIGGKSAQGNVTLGWEGMVLTIAHVEVIRGDSQGSDVSDLAGGFELLLLQGLGKNVTVGTMTIKKYWNQHLSNLSRMAVAQAYTRNTIGLIADPTIDAINTTNAYGTMVNMMAGKDISKSLGDVLQGVQKPVNTQVKKVFEKTMAGAERTTHLWKKMAAQRVWDGDINKYDFGVSREAGVWASQSAAWVNEVGYGFAVSPMLGIFGDARSASRWKGAVKSAK